MKKPYVGITGFMSVGDVLRTLDVIDVDSRRLVMVGVLASLKTMRGIQNKWPNRYPTMDRIAGIFPDHPQVLNLIHYNTKEPDTLVDQLVAMSEFGGRNLHGFQLNIAWPSPVALDTYRKMHPAKQIVLQVGGHAFEMVDHSPERLASKVAEYEGLAEYVLLDPSGGYGKPFDPERARNYLTALQALNIDVGLGVAGGLSPTTLNLVEPLAREFPRLSIDAEGRLRTPEDHLDMNLAREYLRKAFDMFDAKTGGMS